MANTARDFDGTDDVIDSNIATALPATRSVLAWIYRDTAGGGSQARIYNKDYESLFWQTGNDELYFSQAFDVTDGQWKTDASVISEDTWTHTAVTYDNTNTANDPMFYIDGEVSATNETATGKRLHVIPVVSISFASSSVAPPTAGIIRRKENLAAEAPSAPRY